MLTVVLVFLLAAIITAIASIMGKVPLWVSVVLLCVVEAVQVLPLK
jgi:hypothetical protein